MNEKKSKKNKKVILFLLCLAYAIILPIAFLGEAARENPGLALRTAAPVVLVYLLLSALAYKKKESLQRFVVAHHMEEQLHKLPGWLYGHRWQVGIVLWLVLTLFQIHGSSIGVYAKILHAPDLDTAVIGYNRPDRFDEWLNMTPFAFSQYVPGPEGTFAYFNSYLRAVPTDMVIVLGQPCWALATLFRPFMWGYLFLPPGNGLAFFWMGRLIILALVTFEFGRLVTKNNKNISALYTLGIVLSPGLQWWFGVNEFVEILLAGQASILILRQYLQSSTKLQQLGWTLAFTYMALMYALAMYPAWQIPFAYMFLIFAIWVIHENRKLHTWGLGDILCSTLVVVIIAAVGWHIWQTSAEAIALLQASEYPGKRFITGGGITWDWLFNSGLGLFMPFSGFTRPQYAFNMAQFLDFAPLGIIVSVWVMIREKKADFLLCALLVLDVIFMFFCLLPWPHWLAAITLLFQVPGGRMIIPISFINVLLLVRVFALWPRSLGWKIAMALAVGIAAFSAWASFRYCEDAYFAHNVIVLLLITFIGVFSICHLRRFIGPFFFGLFLCIGGMINPIAHGTASIFEADLGHEIAAITAVDKGRWICIGEEDTTINNYPVMFGAPTINSYNTYVAWDNWNKLDLDENDQRVVNRCAHFKIKEITEEPSTFSSEHGDLAEITLSREDVRKLGVSYILSDSTDLQPLDTTDMQFKPVVWANEFIIYKVIYQEG